MVQPVPTPQGPSQTQEQNVEVEDVGTAQTFEPGTHWLVSLVKGVPHLCLKEVDEDFSTPRTWVIGRAASSDVTVKDKRVHSVHVKIQREEQNYWIQNCATVNRTYMKGRIMEKNERKNLSEDAKFSLVNDHCLFQREADFASLQARQSELGQPLEDLNPVCAFELQMIEPNVTKTGIDKYVLGRKLGAGNFAEVKHAFDPDGGNVAIKIVNKEKFCRFQKNRHTSLNIDSEIERLRFVSHPNIVGFVETFHDDSYVYLVTEFCPGGDLLNRILTFGIYDEDLNRKLFHQLCSGIEYLHKNSVSHRDLKPENILLSSKEALPDLQVKIADLGLAQVYAKGTGEGHATFCGTPHYMAPEIIETHLKNRTGYGREVDLWSLGVILYIMLSGTPPFPDENLQQCIRDANFEFDVPEFDAVTDESKDLINKLMVANPALRLRIDQVFAHPWLASEFNPETPGGRALRAGLTERRSATPEPCLKKRRTDSGPQKVPCPQPA
mmetsp:Transcript_28165/g.59936  ORF Transcript_28165/g.59936 Transcript_28165/m.59936 type:complete len:496 (+) Transcript_28165:18-1505(+)